MVTKREIKFRAWDKNSKFMFDIGCIDFAGQQIRIGEPSVTRVNEYHGCYLLKDIELMQHTGLKDKNGKEIYEGDIVRASIISEWDEQVPRNEISIVEWDCDRFWCKSKMTNDWYSVTDFNWEVIGNIYENSELLEVK